LAVVICHEYFLHGPSEIWGSKIRGVAEVDGDVVEGRGHPNEVYEPKNGLIRAMQSEINQPREDDERQCPWHIGYGYCPVIQVQLLEGWMLSEDLGELSQGIPTFLLVGKEELQ